MLRISESHPLYSLFFLSASQFLFAFRYFLFPPIYRQFDGAVVALSLNYIKEEGCHDEDR
jgi:hypothetical protein